MKIPSDLKKFGKRFWRKVLSEYELIETHDLERLRMAAKCLDDLNEAEGQIEKDGLFIINRYGSTTEHPGAKTIRDLRLLFIKIIRELGLDLTNGPEPRPPQRY